MDPHSCRLRPTGKEEMEKKLSGNSTSTLTPASHYHYPARPHLILTPTQESADNINDEGWARDGTL